MIKMTKIYFGEPEGVEIDCPDCGGTAIVTDSGVYCPDCAND